MGVYRYDDPQTGQGYDLNIVGDTPTDEEFARLAGVLRQDRADFGVRFEERFGEAPEEVDDGTAIGRGYERGKKQIKQAFGETLGTIGEESGLGFLAKYGQGVEERARQELGGLLLEQPARMQSTDVDGFGSALTYAGEVVGEQIPQLGLGLGAAVAAPIVAGATGVAAPFVIGAGAAAAVTAPILFGNNIQRQEDEVAAGKKASVDVGDALTATFGQATLEGVSDKLLLGVGKPLIGLGKAGWKGLFLRTTGRATGGATTESLTEVGQQMMERAQAGLPIDSDDAIAEYREAAIAGGLIGGGTRATIGSFGERGDTTETTPPAPVEPEAEPEAVQAAVGTAVEEQVSPAQQTEERNAADPAPLEGAAQQTEEQRAVDAAVVATDAATPSAALVKEEANLAGQTARAEDKATKAAQAKTQEFLEPVAQEDRTAALESEQTGQQIEVKAAETVEAAQGTPQEQVIDDDFLANLSVPQQALIRRKGTKKSLIGKKVSDEGVLDELRNYAKISSVPKAKEKVQGFLDTLEVEDAGTRPTGTGDGAEGSGQGVVGSGRAVPERRDTPELATPDQGSVGTSVPVSGSPAVDAGPQPDTLEAEPEVTPDERGVEAVQQLAEQATATPVQQPVQQAPATPAMQQAAIPGQVTGVAQQNIPAPVAPAPRVAPVQGAAIPQAQLQEAEAARDTAAQAQIEAVFANNRGKQPEVREYHDTQLDPRDVAEVTTAVDKEGVVELLNTKDGDLDAQGKAAKLYFKRFRRPVDALAEIGATAVVGPTQTIEKDYTPKTFAFYKGMTQKSAMNARRWVHANMSDSAIQEMGRARRVANRNTAKYNPSDAYIGVVKAAKSIQQKEDNALKNQLNRYLASPEVNYQAPADLDQSLRAEATGQLTGERTSGPITGSFKPVKGQTAFDSYMTGMGFKKRKVPNKDEYNYFDPENDNKVLTPEEVQEFYDGLAYTQSELGFLLIDPVHGLDQALLPSIRNALQRGDLQFALNAIASTSQVDRIRQIAGKLAEAAGTTQVQVVDDLQQMVGRKAAGMFEPETNTIYIDASNGMNVHTILHEMTHAATSASLANPSLPEVKQLQTIFNAVREQFGEVYGTANLDEFVAEAFSNPEFQSALALTKVDGGKMSGWEKFTGAIKRIVRKILGLSPSASALTEVDRIIDGMLAPSPATRAAPNMLLMAGTKKGASNLAQSAANLAPEKLKDYGDVVFNEGVGRTAKSWTLNTLPVNILTDTAVKYIPFARDLNMLINKQSGALRQKSEVLDSMLRNLHRWQRKNKGMSAVLNNIIPRSTYLKIDPSRKDAKYMKTIRDDKERSAEYDALRAEYNKLDAQGKEFYGQMRNYFQDTYDDIIVALDARLDATIPDAEAKKNAFEALRKLLQADSGVIRPYFPLQRKGEYRLVYTAPDPDKGNTELFVEYYPTLRKAEQARAAIANVDAAAEITSSANPMSFDKAPSTSFVRNILDTVALRKDSFSSEQEYKEAMQAIVDLSLDAMPERSFMQNFRKRKGVRGFLGDTTPTGMGGMEFDAFTMLKEKGRDLNRQLVQLKSAAEIEKFRAKLAGPISGTEGPTYKTDPRTAMMAEKLDQIARFAQSPNVPRYSQVVNSMGFAMTMGMNFSSAAITFFDVAMSAMPVLAGKHKIGPTSRAFGAATKLFTGAPRKRTIMVKDADGQLVPQEIDMGPVGLSISNYDLNNLPEILRNVRADILISMGIDQGQFNQSMTQEDLEIGRDAPLETFNKVSGFMFHHSERFNRETTLTAAYMLEVQKMQRDKGSPLTDAEYRDAAQEAINTTEFTLGSTAAAGRPIVAQNGVGNILFLFKRFAISKYYMMAKLAKEAAQGDPVARAAGRNFLITTGLFAGAGGMPLMGGIGAIYNLFADEDEDDFETALRQYVGEGVYGGLANEILGVDLANRISLNSLLYRSPIIDKDQSALWTLIEQLGGPVIGVGLSIERGVGDIYEGEVYRGIESMAPASIRNGLKSFRFATEGATTRRGDPIIEDINPYNAVMQFLGFAPQAYIQQLEANKNARRREDAIDSLRGKLLRRRNMAIREGDRDELEKVERLIEEYNAGLPQDADVRKKRITGETKKRSLRTFGNTTGNMRGGVTTTDFSRSVLDQYDLK